MGRCKREQAEMCVQAVLAVADLDRKDVNLDLIKASGLSVASQCNVDAVLSVKGATLVT